MAEVDSFSLLPVEDGTSAEEDLAAAVQSVLDDPLAEAAGDAPTPFGRTPKFDFDAGRFVRRGGEPVWVTGHDALAQWVLMTMHSARFAHRVFSDEFGMEEPEEPLGEAQFVLEAVSDWGERLREALIVHDRIAGVENFKGDVGSDGGITVAFDVVTDEDETISLGPLSVNPVTVGAA